MHPAAILGRIRFERTLVEARGAVRNMHSSAILPCAVVGKGALAHKERPARHRDGAAIKRGDAVFESGRLGVASAARHLDTPAHHHPTKGDDGGPGHEAKGGLSTRGT